MHVKRSLQFFISCLVAVISLPAIALADCPAAPVGHADDLAISFLQANGTQIAPASQLNSSIKRGVVVYDSSDNLLKLCDGTSWVSVGTGTGGGGATPAGADGQVQFNSGGSALGADAALFWDNTNKRLGVGTATPVTGLHVVTQSATPAITVSRTGDANAFISFGSSLGLTGIDGGGSGGHLRLYTANSERLRLTSSGNMGIGGTPHASALLDVASTSQGFLPPRMTTAQRDAIAAPAAGLVIYNTTANRLEVYNGTAWGPQGGEIGFRASYNGQSYGAGTNAIVNMTEQYDLGNTFNPATGVFTAPEDGLYSFSGMVHVITAANANFYSILNATGYSGILGSRFANGGAENPMSTFATTLRLSAGNTVSLSFYAANSSSAVQGYLSGFKVSGGGSGGAGGGGGSSTLAGLSDVDVSVVSDGQALVYNASTSQWEPGSAGANGALQLGASYTVAMPLNQSLVNTCNFAATPTVSIPTSGLYYLSAEAMGYKYSGDVVHFTMKLENSGGADVFSASSGTARAISHYVTVDKTALTYLDAGTYTLKASATNGGSCAATNWNNLGLAKIVIREITGGSGLGGGSGGAVGGNGFVQFSDGAGGFASDAGYVWDNTSKSLVMIGGAASGGSKTASIVRDYAGANQFGANLVLSSASTTDGSFARLAFASLSDDAAQIQGTLVNATSRYGDLRFLVRNGSMLEAMRINNLGQIGIGTGAPHASALVDMASTTRGFLPPRMTTAQRDAIAAPASGLMIYNTSTNQQETFNGTTWAAGSGSGAQAGNAYAFYAISNAGHHTGTPATIILADAPVNTDNVYNTSTGEFTAPVDGVYQIEWGAIGYSMVDVYRYSLTKNGVSTGEQVRIYNPTSGEYQSGARTSYQSLVAGDVLSIRFSTDNGTPTSYGTAPYMYFGGHLITGGGSGGGSGGGGSAAAAGSTGEVQFKGSGAGLAASSQLFWNNSNAALGVGTNSPEGRLVVYGGAPGVAPTSGNSNGGNTTVLSWGLGDVVQKHGLLNNGNAWTQVMRISNNGESFPLTINPNGGNVGIGKYTPAYKLDVAGAVNATSVLVNGVPVASSSDTYWSAGGAGVIHYTGGPVGIGTNTPLTGAMLDVNGAVINRHNTLVHGVNTSAPAGKRVWQSVINNTTGGYHLGYRTDDTPTLGGLTNYPLVLEGGAPSYALYVAADGKLGVGTASPAFKMDVHGAVAFRAMSSQLRLFETDNPDDPADSWHFSANNGSLSFIHTDQSAGPAYVQALTLKQNGRVGIGVTDPARVLTVSSNDATQVLIQRMAANLNINYSAENQSGTTYFGRPSNGALFGVSSGPNLGSETALFITGDNKVGIGTNVPGAKLQVSPAGNALTDYTAEFQSNASIGGAGGILFSQNTTYAHKMHTVSTSGLNGRLVFSYVQRSDGSVVHDNTLVLSGGGVGVNISTPSYAFDVNGTARIANTNNAHKLIISGYGNGFGNGIMMRSQNDNAGPILFQNTAGVGVGGIATSASATAYNTTSDYRLKDGVVPLEGALARVNALPPHRFYFKADPANIVDGFLAHEVQAVAPYAVTGDKDAVDEAGNPVYQAVDYGRISPLLVGAIQELKAENDALRARYDTDIEALRQEIKALREAISK